MSAGDCESDEWNESPRHKHARWIALKAPELEQTLETYACPEKVMIYQHLKLPISRRTSHIQTLCLEKDKLSSRRSLETDHWGVGSMIVVTAVTLVSAETVDLVSAVTAPLAPRSVSFDVHHPLLDAPTYSS